MVTINDINRISIINVNDGVLKADINGYFLDIPMYPKFKNQNIINIYDSLNAPQEFYENLKDSLEDDKQIQFKTIRLQDTEISITKNQAIEEMLSHQLDVLLPDLFNYLQNNTLKETIKYMTDNMTNESPMFLGTKIFN